MLTYSFENKGSDSLYEYLYKAIKTDILKGALTTGARLPSKRAFAKQLGVSTITVENAYAQLIAEGYIYSIPKKGYYIANIANPYPDQKKFLSSENVTLSSGKTTFFADFTSTQTSPNNFPFSIWAKLLREVISEQKEDLMTNPPSGGILKLRAAIASHLKQFRGITVKPEQIIIGAGTEYLYGLLIQLLGFSKTYAVENPGHKKIAHIYESHHVNCNFIDLDAHGIEVDQLENSGADIVHISPSHHFPTGITMPIARRYELLAWAAKSDSRYIIEDDYDSEFRLSGKPAPALQSIDILEKVIYINTFTKSLSSTIRISYMALPPHLVNQFYQQLSFYACTVSNFEQYTLARFLQEGFFEKHINRMRNFYHGQRDALLHCIKNSPLNPYVTIMEEDAGLHFLMKIKTDLPDAKLIKKAEMAGIGLSCLSQFYKLPNREAEHIFLINYSYLQADVIEEAIFKLYQCLI